MSDSLFYLTPWVVFFLGLCLGSFANVWIVRWPMGESVVIPRSFCRSCQTQIVWYDNIPLISYFLLKGKCRSCSARIGIRYPLVELLTGILFLLVYLKYGLTITTLELFLFTFGLVACSFIDLDHFLLPDKLTISGILIGFAGSFLNPDRSVMDSFLGIVVGGGFLWALASLYFMFRKQEGLGGGDIKLLAWIGAVLGWKAIPFVIIVASLSGSIIGALQSLQGKDGLKTAIPFGPYLAVAAMIYILGGEPLGLWYFHVFFPALR